MADDFENHCWKDIGPADVLDIYSHYIRKTFVGPAPALLAPIPAYAFPESAAAALARACEYGAWRQTPAGAVPAFDDFDDDAVKAVINSVLARGGGWAMPGEAARLLAAIGVSVAPQAEVSSADDAVAAARRLGYPVALKAVGPTIVHKTELGAVTLTLKP